MAEKKSFILLSLDEKRIKKIAEALSSETAHKILDFLAEKGSATETEISKLLMLPISTVHYNLRNLMESTLVSAKEFHYSEKGKEVNHYSLSNKYIVIAPKGEEKTREEIKSALFATAIVGLGAVALWLFSRAGRSFSKASSFSVQSAKSAEMLMENTASAGPFQTAVATPQTWPWFLAGGVVAVLAFVAVSAMIRKRN
ncbi:MAG: helix-turn-helix domain-containing protein [Candidatus Woesearchaeota archaeon]|nr:helix-turn-helix domain-containing protein [Candidatus Woesearchaeota archaeon]